MKWLGRLFLSMLLVPSTYSVAADAKITAGTAKIANPTAKVSASKAAAAAKSVADEKIVELRVEPSKIVFTDPRESRRLLVFGKTSDGRERDLTRQAKLVPADEAVKVDADGFLSAVKEGETRIRIQAEGVQTELPVSIHGLKEPHPVTFVRDVMPILNKVGCTAGTCHGAAKGKNGFKLSLRGYDPSFDYQMLVQDVAGRRINRADPPQSLMPAKPTQQVAHGGGLRVELGSRYYRTLGLDLARDYFRRHRGFSRGQARSPAF
jgi:hypothetical protein